MTRNLRNNGQPHIRNQGNAIQIQNEIYFHFYQLGKTV